MEEKESLGPADKEGRIILVSPDDKLDPLEEGFLGPSHFIPSLGEARLEGDSHNPEHCDSIAFTGEEVIEEKEEQSYARNLFDTIVDIEGPLASNLLCIMYLPDGTILESLMKPGEDVVVEDKLKRGSVTTWEWRKQDEDKPYRFFAPADPEILSKLRFSFQTTDNS